jgi:hypothetical protein
MTEVSIDALRENSATTEDGQLTVTIGDEPLPVGQHRFRLTVTDDSGNVSLPADMTLTVLDTGRPTAVLRLRDARGRVVRNGRISHGSGFVLDASRSVDTGGGSIASYTFTLLD